MTIEPDVPAYNWIHHNVINTQGNECVEAKEGTEHNIIEYNLCTGQKDPNSGGIASRGFANVIRYNEIYDNTGAGIRLGGHRVDGVQYGVENQVYGNIIYNNLAGGIKFVVDGQAMVCDNRLWNNTAGDSAGEFGSHYDPAQRCESDMDGKDIDRDSG